MPRNSGAPGGPHQDKCAFKLPRNLQNPVGADPSGHKFDGQSQAVQLSADRAYKRCFVVAQHKAVQAGGSPFYKKLNSGKLQGFLHRLARTGLRIV